MDTQTSPKAQAASAIIDRLDGTSAVALLCDIKPPSVSGWRHDGIPKAQLNYLKVIRPDVFKDPEILTLLARI